MRQLLIGLVEGLVFTAFLVGGYFLVMLLA